ncbi:hypothetical protein ACS0TY_027588 [Phlomoides rotata]
MDREQEEMQFLGLFGIYAESYKLIFRWRKIFSQITLALILPLSFIFLTHDTVSTLLHRRIKFKEYHHLSDPASFERVVYLLFKALYFTCILVFSLLSTSAVVYTIACVYTSRVITFKKVMTVVPRVWKRLMVTFLCTFIGFFAYNILFAVVLFWWLFNISDDTIFGQIMFWIILLTYLIGFIYMTIIWQLASVVTVLEDSYGINAMIKSKNLIKGKIVVAIVIFFKLNFSLVIIDMYFRLIVVYHWRHLGALKIIALGSLFLLLLLKLILFVLVVQTVIYFVCKSYHHENIDKSALSDHLEVYLGDYVPLKAKDVQLEPCRV